MIYWWLLLFIFLVLVTFEVTAKHLTASCWPAWAFTLTGATVPLIVTLIEEEFLRFLGLRDSDGTLLSFVFYHLLRRRGVDILSIESWWTVYIHFVFS